MAGFGMRCPGDDHTNGCPIAAGWEYVALARLSEYRDGDATPGGPDPSRSPSSLTRSPVTDYWARGRRAGRASHRVGTICR